MAERQIVITGASSGIGAETAALLAGSENHLVLVGRNSARLQISSAACCARGAQVTVICADLTTTDGIAAVGAAARTSSSVGQPRVLINCAGSATFGSYAQMPWSEVEALLATNLTAPLRLVHSLLGWLMESPNGQIVNVLSIAATHTFPGAVAYAAAKAGLLAASRSLSAELRTKGLRTTNIIPGATDTPIWDRADFVPNRTDMLSAQAVAEAIAHVVNLPPDRNVDELTLMPPKGIL